MIYFRFLNTSLWILHLYSLFLIGRNPRQEEYIYIIPEQYRTIGRDILYSSTTYYNQHCKIRSKKYDVYVFTKWPMVMFLYDSTMYEAYSKEKVIKDITRSLYYGG